MWICPKCAAHNDEHAPVCPVCGTRWHSDASGRPGPEYPVPVDPWALHAETQTALSPVDHNPPSGPPSGSPYAVGRASGEPQVSGPPSSTRPLTGPVISPSPSMQPYPVRSDTMRPPTIEVTQRTGVPLRWVIAMAVVFVAGVGVAAAIVVPELLSNHTGASPQPTLSSTSPSATPSSAAPDEGGLVVAIAPHLTDGRADEVVAMLDVYFNGINAKDYPAVGSVLDPDGTVDPDDDDDMKELADGTRSTRDSHVTLTSLDDAGDGLLTAEVTFQSNQKAGDGPAARPAETCTRWDIVYTLSHDGAYRIRESDAQSQPC